MTRMTSLPTATDVPSPLIDLEQWVCWREQSRGDKLTKVPINPATGRFASTDNPETWANFDDVRSYALDGSATGIGFVFTNDDPFVGIDLDDARDPDEEIPREWAATIIDQLDSYTERSPSGTGYHVLIKGNLPPGRNRRGDVELYETGRFFTVTGDHVEGTPTTIHERTDDLTTVYKAHIAEDAEIDISDNTATENQSLEDDDSSGGSDDANPATDETTASSTLSDEEVVERARTAANGAKFERLWRGDIAGYDSHSEADMALCCLLAFWTGCETTQIERLFRRSGLNREKWNTVHYGDGRTYGEVTIERAVHVTSDVYEPRTERSTISAEPNESTTNTVASAATPSTEMTAESHTNPLQERERERIATILELEKKLRELETENKTLREELNSKQKIDQPNDDIEEPIRSLQSMFRRLSQFLIPFRRSREQ
ncbi:hypothetical protein [Haladaptatus sp. CMAA 1911]|uniref:phage NrS-1 polymerase family protein n=1 Tax=unclassified Haladaptatus TaxID=2622732 RepID=UPI003754ABAD